MRHFFKISTKLTGKYFSLVTILAFSLLSFVGCSNGGSGTDDSAATTKPGSDSGTNLTMDIGDGTFWVAFQDGPAGSWIQWSPTNGNTYNFPVTDISGRYGVAFHKTESDGVNTAQKIYVIHATVTELPSLNTYRNARHTVSGTLSNYTVFDDLAFPLIYLRATDASTAPYNYSMENVPEGLRDFFAIQIGTAANAPPTNVFALRDIDITGDTTINVDFSDPNANVEAFAAVIKTFISGTGRILKVFFSSKNGTSVEIANDTYDGATPIEYPYITNTEFTQPGDGYSHQVSNASGSKYRIRNKIATADPGNRDIGLGNLLNLTGTAVSTTETTGLSYTPDPSSFSGAPVFRGFQIDLDQTVNGTAHWQIKISTGWLNATAATAYTHPALATVPGFDTAAWDMKTGIITSATVSTATSTSGVGAGLNWIIRKTIGRSSANLDPSSWTVERRLAHRDTAKLDIAREYSEFTW